MLVGVLSYFRSVLTDRKARVLQIVSRWVSAILLAVSAQLLDEPVDSALLAGTVDAIALAAIALLGFVLDLVIHRVRHGGVVKDVVVHETLSE